MLKMTKEVRKIQKSRNKSIKNRNWDAVHLMFEESQRKLRRVSSLSLIALTSSRSSDPTESSCKTSKSKIAKSWSSPNLSLSVLKTRKSFKSDCPLIDPLDHSHSSRLDLHQMSILQQEEKIEEDDELLLDEPFAFKIL